MLAKIYKHLDLFFLLYRVWFVAGGGEGVARKDVPRYTHLCLDTINFFLSPNHRWRSMFSESDGCHRNLDQLQQGGASRLFRDTAIKSEGIKRPSVPGWCSTCWFCTSQGRVYSACRCDLKVAKHKCHCNLQCLHEEYFHCYK